MSGMLARAAWNALSTAKVLREFLTDFMRYSRYATPTGPDAHTYVTGANLECILTKDYHRIEKGLALPEPKRPFGADPERRIGEVLGVGDSRDRAQGWDGYLEHAGSALRALEDWNRDGSVDADIAPDGESLGDNVAPWDGSSARFFNTRRSVRDFDPEVGLAEDLIRDIVETTQSTPSVCNRQTARVYYFARGAKMNQILGVQTGNKGFGHTAAGLFVVTSDARLFSGSGERNQRWIDGGLFAMTLVWALHARGVASCMLNWSKGNGDSRTLRGIAGIPEYEDVVVLIAVGYPRKGYRVARSPRRPLDQVLHVDHS